MEPSEINSIKDLQQYITIHPEVRRLVVKESVFLAVLEAAVYQMQIVNPRGFDLRYKYLGCELLCTRHLHLRFSHRRDYYPHVEAASAPSNTTMGTLTSSKHKVKP